ncbi:MAG TPA: DUF952 domain-containing protein, partial [Planctomycetota bacterium]|nr:DUF952 domain-containing protein [Planctomycetota bacterium]
MPIYHIASRQHWDAQKASGVYRSETLDAEGFIHCSTRTQVLRSAEKHFKDRDGLALLCIEPARVKPEIRWENTFPHIYGPLNTDAVLDVLPFERDASGPFTLPAGIEKYTGPQNLIELLDASAAFFGSQRFAVSAETGRELSFAALQRQSHAFARSLAERFKIEPRQHVAILVPNCLELLPIYFGILRANCVAVPINARLKAEELTFILGDSEAQAVVVHPGTWKPAQEALKALNWQRPVIAAGFETPPSGTIPLDELLAVVSPPLEGGGRGRGRPASDDVAAIIYTSGTTGRPKGAMLTHGNILFNIESTKAGHGLRRSDIHLLVVPLFHVTGLNTIMPTALEQGGVLVVSNSIDPEEIIDTVEKFGCTTFFGVPTTFYLLANIKDLPVARLKTLRMICYSGAPMSPLTIKRLRELFPNVELHNFYGLTETTSVTTVLPDEQALPRAESIGKAPPGLELCIMDDKEAKLAPGEVGELCIKGPSVFKGYFKRPEATADTIRDGWFHSGDVGVLDEDGFLFIVDRLKDVIVSGGENIASSEVERV